MSARDELLARIRAQGDIDAPDTPAPIVSLEDFFEGNDDPGSIGCNLMDHPGIERFFSVLGEVRDRPDVQEVLVEISEIPEAPGEWPFSERVYVITSASADDVSAWLRELEPDEVNEGWATGAPGAAPALRPGMKVQSVWWD